MEKKLVAQRGKILYCEKLNLYCKATTDKKHTWVEVNESEVKENAR